MNSCEDVDSLDFNDDVAFDDHIEAIAGLQTNSFVLDREPDLALNFHGPTEKFVGKTFLIYRLE